MQEEIATLCVENIRLKNIERQYIKQVMQTNRTYKEMTEKNADLRAENAKLRKAIIEAVKTIDRLYPLDQRTVTQIRDDLKSLLKEIPADLDEF